MTVATRKVLWNVWMVLLLIIAGLILLLPVALCLLFKVIGYACGWLSDEIEYLLLKAIA